MNFELSTEEILAAIKAYLPEEHKDMVIINSKLDEINYTWKSPEMGMYGSVAELMYNARKFHNFPGSQNYFGFDPTETFRTDGVKFGTSKRNHYVYKHDGFEVLQITLCDKIGVSDKAMFSEIMSIMCYYMRAKENQLGGYWKLVPHETMDQIRFTVWEKFEKLSVVKKPIKLVDQTPSEVIDKFKKLLPRNEKDPEYEAISTLLKSYFRKKPVRKNTKFYETWLNGAAKWIRLLDSAIEENPEWFNPKTGPARVRLIAVGTAGYVMPHELLSEMCRAGLDCRSIEDEVLKLPSLSMWNLVDLPGKIGAKTMNSIVFVLMRAQQSKHRAVYIPTIDGTYCIPAVDAFFELLYDMISVKCLFQNVTQDELSKLIEFILFAIKYFTLEWEHAKGPHFIKVEDVASFNSSLYLLMEKSIPKVMSKKKLTVAPVRNVLGFNGNDLKGELQRLGLDKTFPGINQYADIVVDSLKLENLNKQPFNKDKKIKKALGTRDLFEAVERCQIVSIYMKSEEIISFLHSFDSCRRFFIECRQCQDEKMRENENKKLLKSLLP